MGYISREERERASGYLNRWINSSEAGNVTAQQYRRLASWLNGKTFQQIANEEGVTAQAISQSIRHNYKRLDIYILSLQ